MLHHNFLIKKSRNRAKLIDFKIEESILRIDKNRNSKLQLNHLILLYIHYRVKGALKFFLLSFGGFGLSM